MPQGKGTQIRRAKRGPDFQSDPNRTMVARSIQPDLEAKTYQQFSANACSADGGISLSRPDQRTSDYLWVQIFNSMSTEIRNWDVVAKAMEASGATSSQMYQRAKALAEGKLDPMPTSFPEAPYSISAIAS